MIIPDFRAGISLFAQIFRLLGCRCRKMNSVRPIGPGFEAILIVPVRQIVTMNTIHDMLEGVSDFNDR
jgi:hypothetical protein